LVHHALASIQEEKKNNNNNNNKQTRKIKIVAAICKCEVEEQQNSDRQTKKMLSKVLCARFSIENSNGANQCVVRQLIVT
jgi:hypothetical protein